MIQYNPGIVVPKNQKKKKKSYKDFDQDETILPDTIHCENNKDVHINNEMIGKKLLVRRN